MQISGSAKLGKIAKFERIDMKVIGLTGGVGSGKSLVAQILKEKMGAELIITDDIGHIVMGRTGSAFKAIVERFGEGIISETGEIDRNELADIVFNDKSAIQDLNNIVHPKVKEYIEKYISDRKEKEGNIILESAILFETECDKYCDEVWYVYVTKDIRIARLKESRGYSDEKCDAVMKSQKPDEFYISRCDRVIKNDGSVDELKKQLKQTELS